MSEVQTLSNKSVGDSNTAKVLALYSCFMPLGEWLNF